MNKFFEAKIDYEALKGNEIDQLLAEKIDSCDVRVPIVRLETTFDGTFNRNKYVFGSKLIIVRVHKGKLMVRVGGGYVEVEEFVVKYQSGEIARLK